MGFPLPCVGIALPCRRWHPDDHAAQHLLVQWQPRVSWRILLNSRGRTSSSEFCIFNSRTSAPG